MATIQPTWNEHGLSFVDADANIGVKDLGLRLAVDGVAAVVRYGTATEAAFTTKVSLPK
jgi:hypothetical protein